MDHLEKYSFDKVIFKCRDYELLFSMTHFINKTEQKETTNKK